MTLRQYLILMLASTGVCWAGWISIVRIVDPISGGILALTLFYVCLGLSLLGSYAIAGLLARTAFRPREPAARHAASAFRQGLLFSVMSVTGLLLQSQSLLTAWNMLMMLSTVVVLEFLLISLKTRR